MYEQTISLLHRTAFIFALDRSGSMAEFIRTPFGECSKAEALCHITNTTLFELVEQARRSDRIRDYYDIAVIGYSGLGVEPLIDGDPFLSVDRLDAVRPEPVRSWHECYTPAGEPRMHHILTTPWITPCAKGQTPAYAMLCDLYELLQKWCDDPRHAESFPPMVFNITDGEASDCSEREMLDICRRIRELKTRDGNVLLFHCHLSSSRLQPSILFPTDRRELGENRYARLLYDCSSPLPARFEPEIRAMRDDGKPGPFRGMSYNCSFREAINLLQIGTRSCPVE